MNWNLIVVRKKYLCEMGGECLTETTWRYLISLRPNILQKSFRRLNDTFRTWPQFHLLGALPLSIPKS